MRLQEFIDSIEKNLADAVRHPKYGYILPVKEPIEIDIGNGKKSRIPFGAIGGKPQKDGRITPSDIVYLSNFDINDKEDQNQKRISIPFAHLFMRNKGVPLMTILEKYIAGIPLTPAETQALMPLIQSAEQIEPEIYDDKDDKKSRPFTWFAARQFLVDRYGMALADSIMERLPPDAGIDEIKKFFKENDIDIPDAFLTKNGFKKYLAKHAVRQLESFLDSSKRFDDILSSHPKAGSLWNEWKDVRQGASFESQAMARVLEMQLYDIIGNDPVLSNQLNEAMKQMNVSIDDFTTLAKDPDVMEELGKNSRDVLSQFDLDNKKLIDDIKHFTKADEKGTFGKAMEDIEKKMEEMMDFIKQVSRAIQNLLARTFGREA